MPIDLNKVTDELFTLRKLIKKLSLDEEHLKNAIKDYAKENALTYFETEDYEVKIGETIGVINPNEFLELVGIDNFVKAAKINKTDASNYLGKEDLELISSPVEIQKVSVRLKKDRAFIPKKIIEKKK